MSNLIISIRGTHGSGKSTIVKKLLMMYDAKPCQLTEKNKPLVYSMLVNKKLVSVIGNYENACGGCDTIQPYDRIWPLVDLYAKSSSVIFEGALVSSSYGNIGRASEAYGDQMIFAYLTTPLEICFQRIMARRESKGGVVKPLNKKNTTDKYDYIMRLQVAKVRDEFKRRVVMLDYRKPIPQLLGLLRS